MDRDGERVYVPVRRVGPQLRLLRPQRLPLRTGQSAAVRTVRTRAALR